VRVRRLVRALVVAVSVAGLTVVAPASADAQVNRVRMVSETADGVPGDDWSGRWSEYWRGDRRASADGRFVVFDSWADNLAPGSSPCSGDCSDVFVKDLSTGEVEQLSVGLGGAAPDGASRDPSITPDGRFVVFVSWADNLVPGDGPYWRGDVYRHDRDSGVTEMVSDNVPSEDAAYEPTISDDGRYVTYHTDPWDENAGLGQVYLRDMTAATTTLVSHSVTGGAANRPSKGGVVSGNGRYVAFVSAATDVVAGTDPNSTVAHIYRRDRVTGSIALVSRTANGTAADGGSYQPSISRTGSVIAFSSLATNLGIANPQGAQVYVRVLGFLGGTSPVSLTTDEIAANGRSYEPSISADGRYVAFRSEADNLVTDDTDDTDDVFVRDRTLGTTARVTLTATGAEPEHGARSGNPSITADGTQVVFDSQAENLVPDGNNTHDVFIGPADGVQVPPAPLTITDLSCRRSVGVVCSLTYTGGAEPVQIAWTADAIPVDAARNRTTMTRRCPSLTNPSVGVSVFLTDDLGATTQRSVTGRCP
jgi:Tol biopolymer transport system component